MKINTMGAFLMGCLGTSLVMGVLVLACWPAPPPVPAPAVPKVYADGVGEAVFIRGSRWGIVVGKKDEILDVLGMYALTDCPSKRIYVHSSLTIANQRDTILHELLHAGTCDEEGKLHNKFYNSDDEADHAGIYKIANYMSELLHEKPRN